MMIVEPLRTAPGVGGRGYTAAPRSCRILAVTTVRSGGTTGPASKRRTGANRVRMARSDALSSRARQLTPQARERGISVEAYADSPRDEPNPNHSARRRRRGRLADRWGRL